MNRKTANNRRNYRLTKARKLFESRGFEVNRGHKCLSIVVWEHPRRGKAKIGETVEISVALNWDEKRGYLWSDSLHDISDFHDSHDLQEVVRGFEEICSTYTDLYMKEGAV